MKQILLLSILFFLAFISISNAQPIANGSFENWTISNLYNDPSTYSTANLQSYFTNGVGNVNRTTDKYHGNYAAHLETVTNGTDTVPGIMYIGTIGNSFTGGIAYSSKPTWARCYTKYNIQEDDTAVIYIFFKNNGNIIGIAGQEMVGSKTDYSLDSMYVNWYYPVSPDTIFVLISSSKLDGSKMPGSTLTIDSISFKGTTAIDPFPNGDFEDWTPTNIEEPDSWKTTNFANTFDGNYAATKTADSYDGTYALKLKNVATIWGDTLALTTNGSIGSNGPSGGQPVTQNPQKVSFWYKYAPVGNDTAFAIVFTYRVDPFSGSTVLAEQSVVKLNAATNYTLIEMPLAYNNGPIVDSVNITFASGNIVDTAAYIGLGSTLLIDKVEISYYNTFIDLSVISPAENFDFCGGSVNDSITIAIQNVGTTAISAGTNITVLATVDGGTQISEPYALENQLESGDYIEYKYNNLFDLSALGNHIYAFGINYASDSNNSNDVSTGIANHVSISASIVGGDTIYANELPDTLSLTDSYNLYFWSNSNGTITGNDSTFKATAYGWYYVTVDNGYDCIAEDSVFINNLVGVEAIHNSSVNVYPNPANDVLNIDFNLNEQENIAISFYNLQGEVVYQTVNYILSNNQSLSIDISNFATGLYFYQIKLNKCLLKGKIIVNR